MNKTVIYGWLPMALVVTGLAACVDNSQVLPTETQEIEPEQKMSDKKAGRMAPGTIELPASMLAPVIADLAARVGAPESAIRVLRAIPVIWNDGSRGCPQPGMSYTQALVPGHWVVVEYNNRSYSYHADQKGKFRLCATAGPDPAGPPPHGRYNTDV